MKIMIVEDQTILRDTLKQYFEDVGGYYVSSTLGNANDALSYCKFNPPDLVLMDVFTENDANGLLAAKEIKAKYPHIKIVIMTGFPDVTFIEKAKNYGVDSFIYKDSSLKEMVDVLERTNKGEKIYPRERSFEVDDHNVTFSRRELEILKYCCMGLTRKQIADSLSLQESTIKTHIRNMLVKTGFASISKLAIYAVSKGYLAFTDDHE